MADSPREELCEHGEVRAWCGFDRCIAARKSMPVRVWRTPQGRTFHRKAGCEALVDGHRKAERFGHDAHAPESVPLSVAMSAGLMECAHCFPENVPANAKPCRVRVGGQWVDGFLLRWERGGDGRWKGHVNYRRDAERITALKDEADLRPGQAT